MENLTFTSYETGEGISISKGDVFSYRGGSYFTTIYLKSGEVLYVKEDFFEVDRILDL